MAESQPPGDATGPPLLPPFLGSGRHCPQQPENPVAEPALPCPAHSIRVPSRARPAWAPPVTPPIPPQKGDVDSMGESGWGEGDRWSADPNAEGPQWYWLHWSPECPRPASQKGEG